MSIPFFSQFIDTQAAKTLDVRIKSFGTQEVIRRMRLNGDFVSPKSYLGEYAHSNLLRSRAFNF